MERGGAGVLLSRSNVCRGVIQGIVGSIDTFDAAAFLIHKITFSNGVKIAQERKIRNYYRIFNRAKTRVGRGSHFLGILGQNGRCCDIRVSLTEGGGEIGRYYLIPTY